MGPKLGSALGLHISQLSKSSATGTAAKVKSLEFTTLIKAIGECKAKVEEDAIMEKERELLKKRLSDPNVDKTRLQEYLLRALYVEMLGHPASFAHIHAVKMTCEPSVTSKKVGYLAVSLFLDDSSDLLILIVNTLQQDLRSSDPLCVTAALTAVCKVVSGDAVSSVLPQVADCLKHPSDHVRKKAVMALHRFYQRAPATVAHMTTPLRQMLADPDPSVMAATLCAIWSLASDDPAPYRNLVPSFVNILKQCIERKLPKGLDYPRSAKALPAPFVQIKLIKLLAALGKGDQAASQQMYAVLAEALRAAENGTNIGNAIISEAVKAAATIFPNPALLAPAAEAVARFIRSKSNNLKYIGIDALCDIVLVSPGTAVAHQMAVLECLEDPDVTLRRKTLDLLYRMVKPGNVEVIASKMLDYVRGSGVEEATVEQTCARVAEMAEKFAPSTAWFVSTMNAVFELGGPLVKPALAHNLMSLLAEGMGGEGEAGADADAQLRRAACEAYWDLLASRAGAKPPPPLLLTVALWTLGEYGVESAVASCEQLQGAAALAAERAAAYLDPEAAGACTAYALSCLAKLVSRHGAPLAPAAAALASGCLRSRSTDLSQRASELLALAEPSLPRAAAAAAYPLDGAVGSIDPGLSFLDAHVAAALAAGASPYLPREARSTFNAQPAETGGGAEAAAAGGRDRPGGAAAAALPPDLDVFGLGTEPSHTGGGYSAGYALPAQPQAQAAPPATAASSEPQLRLDSGASKKWGRHTVAPTAPPPAAAAAAAAAAPPAAELLSFGAPAPPAAAIAAAQQRVLEDIDPQKAKLAASLFGGAESGAAPAAGGLFAHRAARQGAPHAAAPPPPRPAEDLLGGLTAPAPAPARAAPVDPFAGMNLSGPAPPPPPASVFAGLSLGAAAPPPAADPFAGMSLSGPAAPPASAKDPFAAMQSLSAAPPRIPVDPFAMMPLTAPGPIVTPSAAAAGGISLDALMGSAPPPPAAGGFPGMARAAAPAVSLSGSETVKGAKTDADPFASLFS